MWVTVEREPSQHWEAPDDYILVGGEFGCVRVSREVGAWIGEMVARRVRPRWLEFVDATGSLVRVRTREVEAMCDSSPRQRARARLHRDMIEAEGG